MRCQVHKLDYCGDNGDSHRLIFAAAVTTNSWSSKFCDKRIKTGFHFNFSMHEERPCSTRMALGKP